MAPRLLLASQSPRRKAIFSFWGISFRSEPARGIHEVALAGETPGQMVSRLANLKAREVSQRFSEFYIIGADTVVVAQGNILGKPKNRSQAFEMIKILSGRNHQVYTGVAMLGPRNKKLGVHIEVTQVSFRPLTDQEIEAYVQTPEPYDKAGGYDIRGQGGRWVDKLKGDYFNVMGLPVGGFVLLLNRFMPSR